MHQVEVLACVGTKETGSEGATAREHAREYCAYAETKHTNTSTRQHTHARARAHTHTDPSTAAEDELPSSENGYHFVTMRFGAGVKGEARDGDAPQGNVAGKPPGLDVDLCPVSGARDGDAPQGNVAGKPQGNVAGKPPELLVAGGVRSSRRA